MAYSGRRAYKYRLNPTPQQAQAMDETLWRCRTLYNTALEQRIAVWKARGLTITCSQQQAELPDLKAALPEYADIHSQVLQDVLTRLDKTYQAFFRRVKAGEKPGFPSFPRPLPLSLVHLQAIWQRGARRQRLPRPF